MKEKGRGTRGRSRQHATSEKEKKERKSVIEQLTSEAAKRANTVFIITVIHSIHTACFFMTVHKERERERKAVFVNNKLVKRNKMKKKKKILAFGISRTRFHSSGS